MTGGSWPDDAHRAASHGHTHIGETGEHAHVHAHDGVDHSHMHVHVTGERQEVPRPHSGDDDDDEVGVLITDGTVPKETRGRHCRHCGEYITTRPVEIPWNPGPYVAEYQHVNTRTVHCPLSWVNGNLTGLGPGTAQPCWTDGCLSNAEHEALMRGATGN